MIRVRVDGKSNNVGVVVAFVGGDHQVWAVIQWGERFSYEALDDLRAVAEPDPMEEAIAERNRRRSEAAERMRHAPLVTGYRSDPLLQNGPVRQEPTTPDPDRPVAR